MLWNEHHLRASKQYILKTSWVTPNPCISQDSLEISCFYYFHGLSWYLQHIVLTVLCNLYNYLIVCQYVLYFHVNYIILLFYLIKSINKPNQTEPKPIQGQGRFLRIFSGRVGLENLILDWSGSGYFLPGYETFLL